MLGVKARVRASPNQTPWHWQVVRGMELVHAVQSLPTFPEDTTRHIGSVLLVTASNARSGGRFEAVYP